MRLTLFTVLVWCLIGAYPAQARQSLLCNPNLPPRLIPGESGAVTPGDANRVRSLPTTAAEAVGTIPGEGQFTVIHGPLCADGFAWWYVDYAGLYGWTVEGADDTYWLEPLVEANSTVVDREILPGRITSVNYNDIAMLVPSELANGAIGSRVAATDNLPTHTAFTLMDYVASGEAILRFYPAGEYAQLTGLSLDDLTDEALPAADRVVLHDTAIMPTDFVNENVSAVGIQYITWDVPADRALEDGELRYVITALTHVGDTLIHAEYSLDSALLPPPGAVIPVDDDAYAEGVRTMLMNASTAAFFPSPADIRLNLTRVEPGVQVPVTDYGVSFMLNSIISDDTVVGEYMPASDFAPEHIAFDLGNRTMFGSGSKIVVYSAADYEASLGVDLAPLRDTLVNRSDEPDTSVGPSLRANRPFIGQAEYVDFQNGTGVRYVAHYTLDMLPTINPLNYVFAGLTDDGQWLILAYIETGVPDLVGHPELLDVTERETYLEIGNRLLDDQNASDFNPALDLIDHMIASLVVQTEMENE